MDRWLGKLAVVTGASSGIGEGLVNELVKQGLLVVGLARRVELVEKLKDNLKGSLGTLHALKVDISDKDEVIKAFQWIEKELGPVHILINNAGIGEGLGMFDGDVDVWESIVKTNLLGLCVATKEAIGSMKKFNTCHGPSLKKFNVQGHIININSIFGHRRVMAPVYSATKHGVTCITDILRKEIRESGLKIKSTSLSPGVVDTNIAERAVIEKLPRLSVSDFVEIAMFVLKSPPHVEIQEIIVETIDSKF